MANPRIDERIEKREGMPFAEAVKRRQGMSVFQMAGEFGCHVEPFKRALRDHGFVIVTTAVLPEEASSAS